MHEGNIFESITDYFQLHAPWMKANLMLDSDNDSDSQWKKSKEKHKDPCPTATVIANSKGKKESYIW